MQEHTERQMEIEYQSILDALPEAVFVLSTEGRILHANQTALERYGYSLEELQNKSAGDLAAPELRSQAAAHITAALHRGDNFEWLQVTRLGKLLPVEICAKAISVAGKSAILSSVRDISERKRLEDQVRHFAYHDQLTQLPNRRLLADRLSQAMSSNKRKNCFGAVLFVDLDHFKPINDLHGHDMGDLLLIEVARRLSGALRSIDTVARLGGDEFVVVLGELHTDASLSATQAKGVAEKLRSSLAEPYTLRKKQSDGSHANVEYQCTASIGVSLFDQAGEFEDVLRPADIAMYQAKQAGGNSVRFYSSKISRQ